MRKLTHAVLLFAYLFLGLSIAALTFRAGLGVAVATTAVLATFATLLALHVGMTALFAVVHLKRELSAIREAHHLLADALESTQGALGDLATAMESGALSRTEELSGEVKMLESLIQQMSDSLDARLSETPVHTAPDSFEARRARQSHALIETVREALIDNRVDLYLQPIVTLPQRRTTFYESFTRLRDVSGRIMMPAEYLSIAEGEGLVGAIDNLLLFRCAQIVRRLAREDRRIGVFCNVSLASLGDESFFPQFLDFLSENRDLKDALIFELGQATFDARGAVEARNMAKLADLGFRFSLDKVQTLDLDFADLQRSDVKFLKIGADLMIEQLMDADAGHGLSRLKDIRAEDYVPLTRRYGLEVIAEKVESERQIVDILDLDVSLGQGHLFGEPRAIKDAVLAETDPPAEFLRATLQGTERRRRTA